MKLGINGVLLPPGMELSDFFRLAKEGKMASDLGKLSSELYNDSNNLDSRLDLFMNMLNYNPGAINGNAYGHSNAIDAVNYATHGNQMGIENSLANASSQIYDFPTTTAAWNAKAGYGLPLWYAKMKGLVK